MLAGAYERYQQFMTKMELETYYISTRTGPNRFVMPWETLIPSSQNGMSSPAPEENGGDGGGGNGNTDEQAPDTLWEKAKQFYNEAMDSPLGIAAGIVVFAGTALALAASAPVTLAGAAAVLGTAWIAGIVTNLLVGGGDAAYGAATGKSSADYVSPAMHQGLRNGRNVYFGASAVADTALLAVGGIKLALGALLKQSPDIIRFPTNPRDLFPHIKWEQKTSRMIKYLDDGITRIRYDYGSPWNILDIFIPRHHGPHYHVEILKQPGLSWKKTNVTVVEPPGYVKGSGTGFLAGEPLPSELLKP